MFIDHIGFDCAQNIGHSDRRPQSQYSLSWILDVDNTMNTMCVIYLLRSDLILSFSNIILYLLEFREGLINNTAVVS